jgi:hypothetical protein
MGEKNLDELREAGNINGNDFNVTLVTLEPGNVIIGNVNAHNLTGTAANDIYKLAA